MLLKLKNENGKFYIKPVFFERFDFLFINAVKIWAFCLKFFICWTRYIRIIWLVTSFIRSFGVSSKKKEKRINVNGYWKWMHKFLNRITPLHSVTLLSHSQQLFSFLFCWNVCCELISTLLFWQSFQLYSCKFKPFWNIEDRFNRNFSDIWKWWDEKKDKTQNFLIGYKFNISYSRIFSKMNGLIGSNGSSSNPYWIL